MKIQRQFQEHFSAMWRSVSNWQINQRNKVPVHPAVLGAELDSCLFSASGLPAPGISVFGTIKRPSHARGRNREKQRPGFLTVTLVFAANVHEVEAFIALADITPKSVDTLPKSRAGNSSSSTFINI